MTKRINVALPLETISVLNSVAPKGNRSRMIAEAVMFYVSHRTKAALAERVKQGAMANALRDMEIAQDWLPAEWVPRDEDEWLPAPTKAKRKS